MSFFSKFRLSRKPAAAEAVAAPTPAESVEALRRRARHRLIGATVLVLLAVVLFPMVFDTQPRAIPVDVPIVIPDRTKVHPLTGPASGPASVAASDATAVEPPPVEVQMPASVALPGDAAASQAAVEPPAKSEGASKRQARTDAGSSLDGQSVNGRGDAPSVANGRFVVQLTTVYTDSAKARDVRRALEKAGLATYAQVLDAKDGQPRIRVRLGPFGSKAEADKMLARVRAMELSASVLSM